ncbi:MAG: hypothetical protein ABIP58_00245 [Dehalococcoidia bacterium]
MQAETGTERGAHTLAADVIDGMRTAVAAGADWYATMLEAIRNWPLPMEVVNGREFRYLVGGEAFDWLLLAERLSAEISDFIPEDELTALLFHERAPVAMSEEEFQALLGAKHKAHLNFVYGVRVEAALQMAVMEEIRKEHHGSRVWAQNGHMDDEMYQRIYGKVMDDLLEIYRSEGQLTNGARMSLAELNEWRYWVFQFRIKNCDPEKVASDTRKGLALLQRLEACARAKTAGASEPD